MFPGINSLSKVELAAVKWQYRLYGGFYTTLWQAITLADEENLDRLEAGFPVEVEAYKRYRGQRGWWEAVQSKLFDKFPKNTPTQWCLKWNLTILDWDGWRDKSDSEAITEEEFFDRAAKCTCTGNMSCFDEYRKLTGSV